jgi:uncharacterized protein YjbI with pentapeptide repeats
MNDIKEYWKKHKGICILGIVILFGVFCYFYSDIASNFTKDNPNGEFFKVILSVLGGIGIIYGLWINSQRIKAQNKQNKLVEDRNLDQKSYDADKRFGEAIGYLGSENTSIVLGGIYALYQLAKEDDRYTPIVAGLFTSYLKDQSKALYKKVEEKTKSELNYETSSDKKSELSILAPITIQTIINLLFSSDRVFVGIRLELSNTEFKFIDFNNNISNCSFDNSEFFRCNFYKNISDCSFDYAKFNSVEIGEMMSLINNCTFWFSIFEKVEFDGEKFEDLEFSFASFSNTNICPSHIAICNFQSSNFINDNMFYGVDSFTETFINKKFKNSDNLKFRECKNMKGIKYL